MLDGSPWAYHRADIHIPLGFNCVHQVKIEFDLLLWLMSQYRLQIINFFKHKSINITLSCTFTALLCTKWQL